MYDWIISELAKKVDNMKNLKDDTYRSDETKDSMKRFNHSRKSKAAM